MEALKPTVMLINARGDYLLNLPAIRALSRLFGGRLSLICRPGARQCFYSNLKFRRVWEPPLDFSGLRSRFDAKRLAERMDGCDLFLCLNSWHDELMDEFIAEIRPTISIGYDARFTLPLPLDFDKHNADLGFDLPRSLEPDLRIEEFAQPPGMERRRVAFARSIRDRIPPGCRVLALHAETKSDKMWPPERFRAVLDEFLRRHPEFFVLDLGLSDAGLESGRFADRIILCGRLPLPTVIALVGFADLFLGVDSCFLHAADLYRVPGVGLFGPTRSAEFGFRFGPHRHIDVGGSMTTIKVADVLSALDSLVEQGVRR